MNVSFCSHFQWGHLLYPKSEYDVCYTPDVVDRMAKKVHDMEHLHVEGVGHWYVFWRISRYTWEQSGSRNISFSMAMWALLSLHSIAGFMWKSRNWSIQKLKPSWESSKLFRNNETIGVPKVFPHDHGSFGIQAFMYVEWIGHILSSMLSNSIYLC